MDTKLAQGQFPATFPETFKNFFEMMNEDEDHVELFANLLEDKVQTKVESRKVPRAPASVSAAFPLHSHPFEWRLQSDLISMFALFFVSGLGDTAPEPHACPAAALRREPTQPSQPACWA